MSRPVEPAGILQQLSNAARHIEKVLRLTPPRQLSGEPPVPTPSALLAQLADEQGQLAAVRGLVEDTAHRLARQPDRARPDTAHRLELIARRLYGIQEDLHNTATDLNTEPRPRTIARARSAAEATTRRSP